MHRLGCGISIIFFVASCLFINTAATSAEETGSPESNLEQEIRAASAHYLSALSSRNAASVADCWTSHGVFVDASGESFSARNLALEEFGEEVAAESPTITGFDDTSIRIVTDIVAIERGVSRGEPANSQQVGFLAVWKKSRDRWLLDYVQEFSAAATSAPGDLESLAWMAGEWRAEHDGMTANLSVRWSSNKNYLLHRFTVEAPDQPALVGEQRLAWDAAEQQVRSWLFRSDGGFIEGAWQRDGEVWISKQAGVAPDGAKTSSIHIWSRESSDRCLFKSHKSTVDADQVGDLVLEFRRVPEP